MAVPVVLNEASHRVWPPDRYEGISCIQSLGASLRELAKLKRAVFLLGETRIGEISLGDQPLSSFLSEQSARDSIRVLLTFANKSPIESFVQLDADGAECFVSDARSNGALYAHLLGTVALSFPSAEFFKGETLMASLVELTDDGEDLRESDVAIPNVAALEHVAVHAKRIMAYRGAQASTGLELWGYLSDWFPALRFLARVRNDLVDFSGSTLGLDQVVDRLAELQAAAAEWDGVAQPVWRSKVTPESQSRQALCEFADEEGVMRSYELHARFTPGAGRIHFRLLHAERLIEVAYIGQKLGA